MATPPRPMSGRVDRRRWVRQRAPDDAARRLYDLALTFQERSQHSEARLVEQFETTVQELAPVVGDLMILDDEDERLWLKRNGRFEAEVVPERDPDSPDDREGDWRRLETPDTLVEFYDPTDVFGDLAEAIANSFPAVAEDEEADEDADPFEDEERRGGRARTQPKTQPRPRARAKPSPDAPLALPRR